MPQKSAKKNIRFSVSKFYNFEPDRIVEWFKYEKINAAGQAIPKSYSNYHDISKESNHRGEDLSFATIKRIRRATEILIHTSKYQMVKSIKNKGEFKFTLGFWTLTLPSKQRHSDKEIKSVALQSFLNIMRKKHGLEYYIWKAEAQANGNVHFHLTTNVFVHYKLLRNIWNYCIEKLGYVTEFKKIHGHNDPNSTDVHSVYKVKNIAAYLCKYMSKKNDGRRKIDGKVYGISESLTKLKVSKFATADVQKVVDKIISENDHTMIECDFATLWIFPNIDMSESIKTEMQQSWNFGSPFLSA